MKALMSQIELAKKVGVSQPVLSRIEKNQSNPSVDLAIKLAQALGVGLDDIFLPELETKMVPVVNIA